VARFAITWQCLGRTQVPDTTWIRETFVTRLRDVEGDDTPYASRSPHTPFEGPLWRFTRDVVASAEHRNLDTADRVR
jgi:hypothetical protein